MIALGDTTCYAASSLRKSAIFGVRPQVHVDIFSPYIKVHRCNRPAASLTHPVYGTNSLRPQFGVKTIHLTLTKSQFGMIRFVIKRQEINNFLITRFYIIQFLIIYLSSYVK